jgi:putative ABC transport system substrate-binding protein
MKRREFLIFVGGMAITSPVVSRAQQTAKTFRIGILEPVPAAQNSNNLNALREGLRSFGYIEGLNLTIDYRSPDGREDQFASLASELIGMKVDLIVTRGTPAVQAAKRATRTIPIVMAAMGAPLLVVDSLSRPGGNVTGMTTLSDELIGKRIELLKEVVPNLSRVGVLHNIGNPMSPPEWEEAKVAGRALALEVLLLDVRNEDDLRRAFQNAVEQHVDALLIGADGLTQAYRRTIVELAAHNSLPAIHPSSDFVEIGGLIAYAVNYPNLYFRAAGLVDKILRGANPAELPVEQPSRFELVVNLRTAKALGLAIPPSVLARADQVIE